MGLHGFATGTVLAPDTIKPLGHIPNFQFKGGAPQFYPVSTARKEMTNNSTQKNKIKPDNKGWSFDERKG